MSHKSRQTGNSSWWYYIYPKHIKIRGEKPVGLRFLFCDLVTQKVEFKVYRDGLRSELANALKISETKMYVSEIFGNQAIMLVDDLVTLNYLLNNPHVDLEDYGNVILYRYPHVIHCLKCSKIGCYGSECTAVRCSKCGSVEHNTLVCEVSKLKCFRCSNSDSKRRRKFANHRSDDRTCGTMVDWLVNDPGKL